MATSTQRLAPWTGHVECRARTLAVVAAIGGPLLGGPSERRASTCSRERRRGPGAGGVLEPSDHRSTSATLGRASDRLPRGDAHPSTRGRSTSIVVDAAPRCDAEDGLRRRCARRFVHQRWRPASRSGARRDVRVTWSDMAERPGRRAHRSRSVLAAGGDCTRSLARLVDAARPDAVATPCAGEHRSLMADCRRRLLARLGAGADGLTTRLANSLTVWSTSTARPSASLTG